MDILVNIKKRHVIHVQVMLINLFAKDIAPEKLGMIFVKEHVVVLLDVNVHHHKHVYILMKIQIQNVVLLQMDKENVKMHQHQNVHQMLNVMKDLNVILRIVVSMIMMLIPNVKDTVMLIQIMWQQI